MKKLLQISISIIIFSLTITSFAAGPIAIPSKQSEVDCIPPYCDTIATDHGQIEVHPIEHASFVLIYKNGNNPDHAVTIVVDPVDHIDRLITYRPVDMILVTDIHRDHYDPEALNATMEASTTMIVPNSVAQESDFPKFFAGNIIILNNDEHYDAAGIHVKTIPMYNLDRARPYHTRGRGNGYVLTIDGKQIYISGDTQAIPEMLKLTDIDAAFVVMNMPFTMDIDEASQAVIEFKPKVVYPYHYRNEDGTYSDIKRFRKLVHQKDPDIKVNLLDWYSKTGDNPK